MGSALSINPDIILTALRDLALVIVATVLLYNVLRWIAKRLFRRMGNLAGDAGPAQTALIIVTSVIIDAIVDTIAPAAQAQPIPNCAVPAVEQFVGLRAFSVSSDQDIADIAACRVKRFAMGHSELAAKKVVYRDVTQKTDALAVFFFRDRQAKTPCKSAHLGLMHGAYRKNRSQQHVARNGVEKVALVARRVGAAVSS